MKKAFIAILLYYLTFHFIVPKLYYLFFGDVFIYSTLIDSIAANKAFWMNFVAILVTVGIILKLPLRDAKIEPNIFTNAPSELFYFSILYSFIFLFVSGGFKGIISGGVAGGILNYINLFLNPWVLLLCCVFLQNGKKPVIFMIVCYIFSVTIGGSRSGVLGIILLFCYGLGFSSFDIYRKRIFKFMKYALILSPLIFVFATTLRFDDDGFDWQLLSNLIVGRVSFIELGMIPIHYVDNGGLDLTLYYNKYSFLHQSKLIIDSLAPGQLFEFDVMPNNYFRAVFFGFTEDFVVNNYMSINITLPVYFYTLFGYTGVLITIVYLVVYFELFSKLRKYPFISLALISTLYEVLVYFDWVMVFNRFFSTMLTILTLKAYMILRKSLVNSINKDKLLKLNNL